MVLALLAGALASVIMPALMEYLEVRSQLAWGIMAPGVLMFPRMYHAEFVSLFMVVLFDGIVYLFVSFIIAHVILRRWSEPIQ